MTLTDLKRSYEERALAVDNLRKELIAKEMERVDIEDYRTERHSLAFVRASQDGSRPKLAEAYAALALLTDKANVVQRQRYMECQEVLLKLRAAIFHEEDMMRLELALLQRQVGQAGDNAVPD
jgi:hypothetical protein